MVQLFYVDDYLIFITSKNNIDDVYASLYEYFKIEHDGDHNKYCCPIFQ